MKWLLLLFVFAGVVAFAQTPTPIPASATNAVTVGPGWIEATNHHIVRTAGNVVYVVASDDAQCRSTGTTSAGSIRVYKGTGTSTINPLVPTGFSEMDTANRPKSAGSGACTFGGGVANLLFSPDVRLSGTTIHIGYIDPNAANNGKVYYQTFDTSTDTWGSRVQVASGAQTNFGGGWPRGSQLALTLDASNAPYIVFASGGTANDMQWVAKTASGGTAWTTAASITGSSANDNMQPSMVTALDGSIHMAWCSNCLATHPTIKYAKFSSGAWGTVETASTGANVLGNGNHDQTPSIATDLSSRPYVLYLDGTVSGTDNYVRHRYRTVGGTWTDNTPPSSSGGASSSTGTWGGFAHTPQNYISAAGDVFIFLGHDTNISPGPFEWQHGGVGNNWSAQIQLDPRNQSNVTAGSPGLDGSASIRFDPLRDNKPSIIDILVYDEDDGTAGFNNHATIYYKAVDIGETANLWIDTDGGTCTRSASPATYNSATACASPSAAWTASSGGDTIIAKGGTYSSTAFSASGTKTSLVTIKAAAGESPWFTQNGSISGVTNMLVYDDRPPNMLTEAGIGNGLTMGLTNIGSSSNITFDGIDLYCQDNAPWPQVTGASGFGTACSARLNFSATSNFTMKNGSVGPEADCFAAPCNAGNVNTIGFCGGTDNTGCDGYTFDKVIFHDVRLLDNPGVAHTSMWIIFRGQNITFSNSRFIRCTDCNSANVFFGQEGSTNTPDLITFIGNEFDSASGCGVVCMGYRAPSGTAPTIIFKYNTIIGPATLSVSAPGGAISYANSQWVGNIITYAPSFDSGRCSSSVNTNNVFGSPDAGTPAMSCGTGTTAATNINLATYFNNPGANDYRLKTGSPAIDHGGSGCTGLTDIAGGSRPSAASCDAGAFEFGATGGGSTTYPRTSGGGRTLGKGHSVN